MADRTGSTYSLLFDMFVLAQRTRQLVSRHLEGAPLRGEEYAVYSVVFEEEAVSQTTMAAILGMPLTTVADHVRAMEARGHCRRIPNPGDGRSHLLVLTASGHRAHRETAIAFEGAHRQMVDALPHGERAAKRELASLVDAARRALDALEPAER